MDDLKLAVSLVETGQYEEGLNQIKDILSDADDETAFKIATLYEEWGMANEAYDILFQLFQNHPGDSNIILTLAESAIDLDQEDNAIEWLLKIHSLDENYLSAQVLLADLFQSEGLEELALNHLMKAKRIAPNEPIIDFALAEFYMSFGYYVKAEECYRKVLHEETLVHENIALKLAESLSLSGQFEEALAFYKEGLDKEKTLDGLFGYAMTAFQLHQYKIAIKALEELKEMDSTYSTLYPLLAESYQHEGALQEAFSTLEAGLKVDEQNERLLLDASDAALKVGERDKAEYYITKLLEWNPEHTESLKKLITLKKEEGKYSDIIQILTKEKVDDPELLWYLADAYTSEEKLEKAIEVFEKISGHFENDPDFLESYGQTLWEFGAADKALNCLKKALKFDPNNENLREFVERIREEF